MFLVRKKTAGPETGIRRLSLLICLLMVMSATLDAQNINIPNKNGPLGTQVNTLTGNLFVSRNDVFVPARGINLNMSFYYNAFSFDQNNGYGNGWSFAYGIHYKTDTAGRVIIVQGDGREDTFSLASGGAFTAPVGVFDSLSQYQSGKYLLQTKDGLQYYFDNGTHRRLTRMQDPNSNFLNFIYTDSLLTSVTNGAGQTITLNYSQGVLSSLVDAMASPARTYSYKYDGSGNLTQVTDPLGNLLKYQCLVNGPLSKITDKNNNTADIIYFPDFTVSELIGCNSHKSFSYDTAANKTTVTDYVPTGANQVTTYTYKKYNDRSWLTNITGNCCGYNMSFVFDNSGNMTQVTDANGNTYKYSFDSHGNILTMTDPLNHVSRLTYSPDFNQVTGFSDPQGNAYAISYDRHGNPLQFIQPGNAITNASYSASGDMIGSADADGNAYTYTYDAFGNPSRITGPLGFSASLVFDPRGNFTSLTDPDGNTTTAQYDLLDRMTSLTDPLNHKVLSTYDANGNMTSQTDQNGHKTALGYDASDRVVTVTDAMGKKSYYAYDAMDNLIKYTDKGGNSTAYNYDNLNRVSSITDALGNSYSFEYDPNGNTISAAYPNGNRVNVTFDKLNRVVSSGDALGLLGTLSYDNNGNVLSYTDGNGAVSTASYDSRNRLIRSADPLGNARSYTYDNNSNLLSSTDRNNHTYRYAFDALNRVSSYTDYNGAAIRITYDAKGNVLSLSDQDNHTTTYEYDALNRKVSTRYPDGGTVGTGYDNTKNILSRKLNDGSVISYRYDAEDRMLSKTMPGNTVFSYAYDARGRMDSASNGNGVITMAYDVLNRLAAESFNGHTTSYNYDIAAGTLNILYPDSTGITQTYDTRNRLSGITRGNASVVTYQYGKTDQLQQMNYGNGVGSNWQYDFANRLSSISTSTGNIQQSSFTYDNERNKTAVTRSDFPQSSAQFNYDPGYRLTGYESGSGQKNTYAYDAVGNRTSATIKGLAAAYTTNSLNQVTGVEGGGQNMAFRYDGNGNLLFDGNWFKTYDAEGRLLSDSSAIGASYYFYDALGRRVQKVTNGSSVKYYYSGLSQVEQRDANTDSLLNETIYNGPNTPVSAMISRRNYYYHQNDLNSVEAITDANGALVERYQYDPYGQPVIYDSAGNVLKSSIAGNRFAFTGQEYDTATGTYHFHFRDYSPATGSFLQRDPLGYADGMGAYQYVHDNPGTNMDILGLRDCGNKVILITNQEWDAEVNKMRALYKSDKSIFWNKAQSFDSKFYSEAGAWGKGGADQMYSFRGNTYSSMEINYYFEGMLFAAGGYSQNNLNDAIVGWKKTMYGVDPTKGVTDMATLGFLETKREMDADGDFHKDYKSGDYSSYQDPSNLPSVPSTDKTYNYNLMIDPASGSTYVQAFLSVGSEYSQGKSAVYMNANDQTARTLSKLKRMGMLPLPKRDDCPPNGNPHGTQKKTPPAPGNPGTTGSSTVIDSDDPNEIIGPDGVGVLQWMSVNAPLPYTILYQNSPAASAPAKTVRINYPIDPKQDLNNFSLGNFGFNNQTFTIPANTPSYYQRLDARDSIGLYVDVTAGLDVINHQVFWTFQSLDPTTLLPPSDPTKGFLLLTDSSKPNYGHGFVNFSIKPLLSDHTGDTTHATASIIFDSNDTVSTNAARNTIDAVAPASHMTSLPATSASKTFTLSWSGQDDPGGSGVQYYTLYLAADNGAYTIYRAGMTRTDTTFTGAENSTYSFFVLATDSAGNTETLRPDAPITVLITPVALPVTWLSFTAILQGKDGLLSWATATESSSDHFEIERSADGQHFDPIGTVAAAGNSAVQTNYTYTDKNVVALRVPVVYYRLQQVDQDGKSAYSNIVALNLPAEGDQPKVTAYPNPFQQTLNILIANAPVADPDDQVTMYTSDGKLVYQRKIGQRMLSGSITLSDLPQLTPGMYVLKLILNKQTYSFKIMKGSK